MISWFSRSRIRKYVSLSPRKQNKVRIGLEKQLSTQNEVIFREHMKPAIRLQAFIASSAKNPILLQ